MSIYLKYHTKSKILSALIGIAVLILLSPALTADGKNADIPPLSYAMYTKSEGERLYCISFPGDTSGQISTVPLCDICSDSDPSEISSEWITDAIQLSKDGELLFFSDDINYFGFPLFYRDRNDPEEKAVKIDSGIDSYRVSDDSCVVTYRKEDGTLRRYNKKTGKRQTVADYVEYFFVSDDGDTVLYTSKEGVFYYTASSGLREKVDIEAYDINCVSEDLSTIYYTSTDSYFHLYKKERGKEEVRIDYETWKVIKAYDTGELYYVTVESVAFPLLRYISDEKKEADAALKKPLPPDRNASNYDTAYRAYQKACREYSAKLKRDEIRAYLEKTKHVIYTYTHYSLYYYDGEKSTLISDSFTDLDLSCAVAADEPVITYTQYNLRDDAGVDLSEIEDADHVTFTVSNSLSSVDRYVAFGASSVPLGQAESAGTNFCFSADGKKLYYLAETAEKENCGSLYQISLSSPKRPGTPKLYDTDVFCGDLCCVGDNNLLYFKNYREDRGELYCNGKKVDDEVNRIIPADSASTPFLQR